MSNADFGLQQALMLWRSYVDQTHRFWGYFQIVAATLVGLAWASRTPSHLTLTALAMAFLVFSIPNRKLIRESQKASVAAHTAITTYLGNHHSNFSSIVEADTPEPVTRVVRWHWLLTGFVMALILLKAVVPNPSGLIGEREQATGRIASYGNQTPNSAAPADQKAPLSGR